MDKQRRFREMFPHTFFLNAEEPAALEKYLQKVSWIGPKESVLAMEKPGDGNMNCVYRITTPDRSVILKQARPWVEKYPQIEAPIGRIGVEATYYQTIQHLPELQTYSPGLLGYDADNYMLMMEDLGAGADYTLIYQKGKSLVSGEVESLVDYLNVLYQANERLDLSEFPKNKGMRTLNHEHIFRFPYMEENGFDLDTIQLGLQEASLPYKTNAILKEKINSLGEVYLSKGNTLLHGDYYPGSWLKTQQGLKVIDPEFGFVGPAEFDLGVFLAHVWMAQLGNDTSKIIQEKYEAWESLDHKRLAGFVGTEILRRFIGLAQLPLDLELKEKQVLMEKAASAILAGDYQVFFVQ